MKYVDAYPTHELNRVKYRPGRAMPFGALNVVFNHTAEYNGLGNYISFRGIDNRTYYVSRGTCEIMAAHSIANGVKCTSPSAKLPV